jgi:hypothetical protein
MTWLAQDIDSLMASSQSSKPMIEDAVNAVIAKIEAGGRMGRKTHAG